MSIKFPLYLAYFNRKSHLILSRYQSNHRKLVLLDYRIIIKLLFTDRHKESEYNYQTT
jgi:hypothetical protein